MPSLLFRGGNNMAITKTITVDDKEVTFRASAAIPRMYRVKFRRDIYADMNTLTDGMKNTDPNSSSLPIETLEIFENIAFIMAKHADPEAVPNDVDAWLDQFNIFSIYSIFPTLIELWGLNVEEQSQSKKNRDLLTGR